ncbi:MAG: cyclic nucleotide-binding domain-containing protein [Desulfobacterales bacterium]|nr:cyclic nucleotide-binding domain-containing protein [Desulfobacterales bacterium]
MLNHPELLSVREMSNLTDVMLKKIDRLILIKQYGEGDYIFREGDYAECLYAVVTGKIGLEVNLNATTPCRILDVPPGRLFGLSSVVDTENRRSIMQAKALVNSKVFCWKGSDLEKLFYEDYELGFKFMSSISKILKRRMEASMVQLADGAWSPLLQTA